MLGRWAVGALRRRWRRYRYRFVPWIALNLGCARTTVRHVSRDKVIADEEVLEALLKIFQALYLNDFGGQTEAFPLLPEAVKSKYGRLLALRPPGDGLPRPPRVLSPGEVLFRTAGFSLARETSSLASAGKGVFVTKGFVPKGAVVAMYPGTIYQMSEPIFFQSIGNPFVFRCLDGVLIDGNDKGISKAVYRSCNGRDQLGPFKMSDSSWLTASVQNPLAVGQYVNNCSNDKAANVCYQEFDVPDLFPIEFKQYLPNIAYSHEVQRCVRCVVLVALREIRQGEELFSNYYTIVT
ncbi:SET domain-containing protein 9 [Tachyglossus aculeatus]|uniref:SET domain-containing protein 9 n=1 Tax=Tachyglossus aculeatus TaxID=9261 RepID=UPI0018F57EF6|nr:SET domain-containing protein 9 [Tachyglossus aculeatus]